MGEVLGIEATFLHPDQRDHGEENYVVSFEARSQLELKLRNKYGGRNGTKNIQSRIYR